MKKLEKLTARINPHEIQWRIQSSGKGKTTVVPYLTNRCVMERFDEEFGALNWSNNFEKWGAKGVKCGISVMNEGTWITKYDGADETHIEATKGGFSDSMKRAAVQWGLGRDLYDYPMIQFEGELKYISRNIEAQLSDIAAKISSGKNVANYLLLKDVAQPIIAPSKPTVKKSLPVPKGERIKIEDGDELFLKVVKAVAEGKATIQQAIDKYSISEVVEDSLKEKIQALTEIV